MDFHQKAFVHLEKIMDSVLRLASSEDRKKVWPNLTQYFVFFVVLARFFWHIVLSSVYIGYLTAYVGQ